MTKLDVTVDGVRLACYLRGAEDAPPLVLLHGLRSDAGTWDTVTEEFARHFRVVAIDQRGHGDSGRPGEYSFELMRDDVLGVLDQLGLDQVSLIGHSMGGTVAYLIAEKEPDRIDRLILEDTPPPFPVGRIISERPDGHLPYDWAVVPAIIGQLNEPDPAWWERLAGITARTLFIAGGPASHVPQDKIAEAAARVPDSRLQVIPVGHQVHDMRPAEFTAAALDFLLS
ncbi:MAG TPA: alpha/beta hydrolase [Streptosporangiaceae bacterium]|nr:alpha/beta hydrolase [Streptosporangiaceae bacterium]